ncbi:putative disease resistance protein RDL5 [Abeliophyllum distichum]|uniref:Disease resistance protein RDL5 n=1 Tax=Abeliophyllum distichum TaxID=126358 RepID=A0ABD1RVH2_9LAMI
MGGIGKTTLAKLTYNDSLIANHFDVRAWVVVSREYREQEVLKGLLNSLRGLNHESGEESIEKLAENVSKFLKDKRYFIVIDDVWTIKTWNRVKSLFPDNNNGSRIILTTRLLKEITGSWDSVSFIYSQLPHHLRACFLYMGVLPEDYEIRRSKLTKLWVANRFIKPDRSKSLEEVAEEYLKDLVDRNLILVSEWSYSGEIKTCSIHDILRGFCLMKAKEEKFNSDVEYLPEFHDNLRQVSILTDLKNEIPTSALTRGRVLRVRAVTFFIHNSPNDVHFFITNFRLLRVLDALTIRFQEFPVEIVELVTLRYIALTYWMKHRFPASIAKLCNLETLIVNPGKFRSIFNTSFLPPEIWKMSRLRHLLFVRSYLPYPTDALIRGSFVPLENLQTLSNVRNFRWTKEEHWKVDKTHLPSLQRLSLRYCYNLVEIPSGIGKIPTLEEIELCECKTSVKTSAQVIQEEKESLGNIGFKVVLKDKDDTDISS